jgi:hypothetical protein
VDRLAQGEAALARSKEELEALLAQRNVELERTNRDLERENQHRKLLEEKLHLDNLSELGCRAAQWVHIQTARG